MYPTRSLRELLAVCSFMQDFPGAWWVGGGWAIDCWLGHQTRDHEDIELCIWRTDQAAIYAYCPDWQYFTPRNNVWAAIPGGTLLDAPHAMVQLQQTAATGTKIPGMPPTFEFLLNDRDGDMWIVPEEPDVRVPLARVSGHAPLHVPAAMPELVLLHKAWTVERAKDDHDFQAIRPQLSAEQRAWLAYHIARTRPAHRWLPWLHADQ